MKLLVARGADPNIPTSSRLAARGSATAGAKRSETNPGCRSCRWVAPASRRCRRRPASATAKASPPTRTATRRAGCSRPSSIWSRSWAPTSTPADHEGNTALHQAAARGDVAMIEYLVSKGAELPRHQSRGPVHRGHGQRAGAAHAAVSRGARVSREPRRDQQSQVRELLGRVGLVGRVGLARLVGRTHRHVARTTSSASSRNDETTSCSTLGVAIASLSLAARVHRHRALRHQRPRANRRHRSRPSRIRKRPRHLRHLRARWMPTRRPSSSSSTARRCHSDRAKAGGLSLASSSAAKAVSSLWSSEKMIHKLRLGMMPPPGARRPDETALAASRRVARDPHRSSGRPQSQSRPSSVPAHEPRGVRARDQQPPRPRS